MAPLPPSRLLLKAKERSLVLLLCGAALLLPPGAQFFHVEGKIGGIPVVLVVLFLIWAALIVAARQSAKALSTSNRDEDFGP